MIWPKSRRVRKLKWDGKMKDCYENRRAPARQRWRTPSHGRRLLALAACVALLPSLAAPGGIEAQERLQVVTTLPTYAAIARDVTGDLAEVTAIARGDEDPHFVTPRPSYAALIKKADLFVATGLDLELWVTTLLDRAGNSRVIDGAPGYVAAYAGIELLDIPTAISRAEGDVHVFGNPHIHTDPINAIIISRNILAGLRRVDPSRSETYEANARDFADRVLRRLVGVELVEILGTETLFELARSNRLWGFLEANRYQERPLTAYVGGWLAQGAPFRDRDIACYHKNWVYFSVRFRVRCAMYVEPKVGIPPSPGHVRELVDWMSENEIPALLAANYFSRRQIENVASRTGAEAVIVPHGVGGAEGVDDYFELVDVWVSRLAGAFTRAAGGR
jgi:zinc/manganese transport system substrate-binding protein